MLGEGDVPTLLLAKIKARYQIWTISLLPYMTLVNHL